MPALLALALAAALASGDAGSGALGPAPRDADGRFHNPGGIDQDPPASVSMPFVARRVLGSFLPRAGGAERIADPRPAMDAATDAAVTWLGHATLYVRHDGVRYLTDPIWSARAGPGGLFGPRRLVPAPLPLRELPPVDFVLISHGHYDHLDLPTLVQLQKLNPALQVFVPLGHAALLRSVGLARVHELDWGASATFRGVEIRCLPAQHWSGRTPFDRNRALWASWAVLGPQRRVFFAGDTGLAGSFAEVGRVVGPFDLAALPIGAYEPEAMMRPVHMNPEEAVAAGRSLGARRMLGIHWGTFDLTDEPLDEPPRRFQAALAAAGLPPESGLVLRIGETAAF